MSFDSAASPALTMRAVRDDPDAAGWGFAWYPMDDRAAVVVKDPNATHETAMTRVLRDWDRFRSCCFLAHTHGAAKRVTQQDTHPFQRSYAGRDWVFAHSGELTRPDMRGEALPIARSALEPVGVTDSEHIFCWLLARIAAVGARSLAEVGGPTLHEWLGEVDRHGRGSLMLSDGVDVVAYAGSHGSYPLHRIRRTPPHATTLLRGRAVVIDAGDPYDVNRTMALVAREPLSDEPGWHALQAGELVIMRRGVFTYTSTHAEDVQPTAPPGASDESLGILWTESGGDTGEHALPPARGGVRPAAEAQALYAVPARTSQPDLDLPLQGRVLRVEHETVYRYDEPVELSSHIVRLHPVHDLFQEVLDYQLEVSPPGVARRAEDVFGNQVLRFKIERPYTELWVRARSRLRVVPPRTLHALKRSTIPLVWMPWQRQMMTPFLLPPELPETQLKALSEYAMSFVERQDYDLVDTLKDIYRSIFRDFRYVPGATMLETSPFTVFTRREGVCQDFATLFICLCRLLGVPARYRVGYIRTGADYENQLQSEASHAWCEVYMPRHGWCGFDPTNGVLANLDHVRVAHGRNYREATPTAGTLFKGGQGERLETRVRVEVETEAPPSEARWRR